MRRARSRIQESPARVHSSDYVRVTSIPSASSDTNDDAVFAKIAFRVTLKKGKEAYSSSKIYIKQANNRNSFPSWGIPWTICRTWRFTLKTKTAILIHLLKCCRNSRSKLWIMFGKCYWAELNKLEGMI